jgi:hypothetical protein
MEEKMPEIQEYQNNKVLVLNPGERFVFSFGLKKAEMILANLEAIKEFVESKGESIGDVKKEEAK